MESRSDAYGLTSRERMVLGLLASGRSNKQIAGMLCISVPTVNTHVTKVLHKMGAASRTDAAVRAVKEALVG